MFVGYTGVRRVVQATVEAMDAAGIRDPNDLEAVRALGVIDLPTIQRKTNLHFSLTLDLFGSEESTNAANFFNAGIKGRYHESKLDDDHRLVDDTYPVMKVVDGRLRPVEVSALIALNARLRDDFIDDCQGGVTRWNRVIAGSGIDFEIRLPHAAFNRQIGEFTDIDVSPGGEIMTSEDWENMRGEWLPTEADRAHIESLMQPNFEPSEFAKWIAPPSRGIQNMPEDFLYVKLP
jgi:benzoyl-CoA 2,3-dioxygenase component B